MNRRTTVGLLALSWVGMALPAKAAPRWVETVKQRLGYGVKVTAGAGAVAATTTMMNPMMAPVALVTAQGTGLGAALLGPERSHVVAQAAGREMDRIAPYAARAGQIGLGLVQGVVGLGGLVLGVGMELTGFMSIASGILGAPETLGASVAAVIVGGALAYSGSHLANWGGGQIGEGIGRILGRGNNSGRDAATAAGQPRGTCAACTGSGGGVTR